MDYYGNIVNNELKFEKETNHDGLKNNDDFSILKAYFQKFSQNSQILFEVLFKLVQKILELNIEGNKAKCFLFKSKK